MNIMTDRARLSHSSHVLTILVRCGTEYGSTRFAGDQSIEFPGRDRVPFRRNALPPLRFLPLARRTGRPLSFQNVNLFFSNQCFQNPINAYRNERKRLDVNKKKENSYFDYRPVPLQIVVKIAFGICFRSSCAILDLLNDCS